MTFDRSVHSGRDLIAAAIRVQTARGWSNRRTSKLIGVARETWSKIADGTSQQSIYHKTRGKLVAFVAKWGHP